MPLTQELYDRIQQSHAKLVSPDGNTQDLPASLDDFLVKLTADLKKGQSVAIVQNDAQVTTGEGARMLGVSRQFLIKLIDRGDIPHYMVGTHRRTYVRDLWRHGRIHRPSTGGAEPSIPKL